MGSASLIYWKSKVVYQFFGEVNIRIGVLR